MSADKILKINYPEFDLPEITHFLFHPRPEHGWGSGEGFEEISIPVEEDVNIGGRFYAAGTNSPTILFFHGNGEIVADYDDLSAFYVQMGVNFFPVDYRGYGKSGGTPSVTAMMRDCRKILEYAQGWLSDNNQTGPLLVMGRSLGSASALELAHSCKNSIDGLIIESGFAFMIPLLELVGVDIGRLGLNEEKGVGNYRKIKTFDKPTLIIHAEFDNIIPLKDGRFLYDNSPDPDKSILVVPQANHNNIFAMGIDNYMDAVKKLADRVV